jgi:hypothetical protein
VTFALVALGAAGLSLGVTVSAASAAPGAVTAPAGSAVSSALGTAQAPASVTTSTTLTTTTGGVPPEPEHLPGGPPPQAAPVPGGQPPEPAHLPAGSLVEVGGTQAQQSTPQVAATSSSLPFTGRAVRDMGVIGSVLFAGGAMLIMAARRRPAHAKRRHAHARR